MKVFLYTLIFALVVTFAVIVGNVGNMRPVIAWQRTSAQQPPNDMTVNLKLPSSATIHPVQGKGQPFKGRIIDFNYADNKITFQHLSNYTKVSSRKIADVARIHSTTKSCNTISPHDGIPIQTFSLTDQNGELAKIVWKEPIMPECQKTCVVDEIVFHPSDTMTIKVCPF